MQFNKTPRFAKFFTLFALTITFLAPAGAIMAQQQSMWLNVVQEGLQGSVGPIAYNETGQPKDIRIIVAGIIQVFLGLLATIFIILIVIAGFKWMSSQGNSVKIGEAKNTILAASVGLLIILGAFAITIYITRSVLGITGRENPGYYRQYQNN